MIVEVVHPRTGEVRQRLRVAEFPFSIGRALDNALILDDPHVDARHARLVQEEDGSVVVEDLGSLNKLATLMHAQAERVRVRAGAEVTVGRTTLRFRDDTEPVPPAIPLHRTAPTPSGASRWYERTSTQLLLIVLALLLAGVDAWLGNFSRSGASDALTLVLGLIMLSLIWAGIWAVAARAVIGQFRFVAHLFITVVSVAATFAIGFFSSWTEFLLPDNAASAPFAGAAGLALLAAVIAWQLAYASTLSRLRRWRAGITVSAVLLALGGLFALVDDDAFTDVPTFSSVIKAAPMAIVPKASVAEFSEAVAELKADVDELRAEADK